MDAGFETTLALKAKWRPDSDALEICRAHGREVARQWALQPLTDAQPAPLADAEVCEVQAQVDNGPRMQCSVCQWIYDPAIGEPMQDVQPGTAWCDVPDSFLCPECSLGKSVFDELPSEAK